MDNLHTFCPEHGLGVAIEMGCCAECGALATGPGVDRLYGVLTAEQVATLSTQTASVATSEPPGEADLLEAEVADFVDEVDDLLARVDDLPERAEDFADSVRDKLSGMRAWAVGHNHVTPGMQTALDNMDGGVRRWER